MIVYNEKDFKKKVRRLRTNMLRRCYNKQHSSFSNYGGNGVTVCDRWINNPQQFIFDIINLKGFEYEDYMNGNLYLDKDKLQQGVKNKIYSPETCVFLTSEENNDLRDEVVEFYVVTPKGQISKERNLKKYCNKHELVASHAGAMINGSIERKTISGYQFYDHYPKEHEIKKPRIYKAINPNKVEIIFYRYSSLEDYGLDWGHVRRHINSGKPNEEGWVFTMIQDGFRLTKKQEERLYDNCN